MVVQQSTNAEYASDVLESLHVTGQFVSATFGSWESLDGGIKEREIHIVWKGGILGLQYATQVGGTRGRGTKEEFASSRTPRLFTITRSVICSVGGEHAYPSSDCPVRSNLVVFAAQPEPLVSRLRLETTRFRILSQDACTICSTV